MKTLKEMQEQGINYLTGYTDALKDFTEMLMNPVIYDQKHTGVLLKYVNAYVDGLIKEKEEMENVAK